MRDDVVAEFVADRLTRGEVVDEHTFDGISATTVDAVEAFVCLFEPDLGAEFTACIGGVRDAQPKKAVTKRR